MLLKDPTGLSENENDRRLLISYHIIKIYTILREREREKRVRVPLIILSNNVVCGFKSVYIYIYIYVLERELETEFTRTRDKSHLVTF